MSGYDHEPVVRRNSLNGGKVLKSDIIYSLIFGLVITIVVYATNRSVVDV